MTFFSVMSSAAVVGIIKYPKPDLKIKEFYRRSLVMLNKIPKNSAYRINTESIICHRLAIINKACDLEEIESKIGCGQMALLLAQAEEEYKLLMKMLLWKPWEPPHEKPPEHQWTWPPNKTN